MTCFLIGAWAPLLTSLTYLLPIVIPSDALPLEPTTISLHLVRLSFSPLSAPPSPPRAYLAVPRWASHSKLVLASFLPVNLWRVATGTFGLAFLLSFRVFPGGCILVGLLIISEVFSQGIKVYFSLRFSLLPSPQSPTKPVTLFHHMFFCEEHCPTNSLGASQEYALNLPFSV